ncbi:helix-turn-helix domain-containing protein [Marinifilum caeruleilacunae]|uniref:AraC family transcriptional regulator n=1 Tax=Marinifilum caeruleilacunae TaxID=2499076 RepID=A0ABX1WUB7_9BACT|nr:helix-turn-helix domain-containing protein [Marinifilum caeruleilacunae]NOU59682.1 AraC family transcriptional regulator [Marinifilum caeruleilacunae]
MSLLFLTALYSLWVSTPKMFTFSKSIKTFHPMDIISLIAAVNALLIAIIIFLKRQKSISDYLLMIWVINFVFQFGIPFLLERNILLHESIWGAILGGVMVLHAPFIFVYTNSLTDPGFKINFKNLYHFGVIFIFIAALVPYLLLDQDARLLQVENQQDLSMYMMLPLLTLLLVQVYFLIRTIIVLINHQNNIKNAFSYEKEINLSWIKRIVIALFGIIILNFIGLALVSAHIISVYLLDYVMILLNIVIFFYLAYSSYKQRVIYNNDVDTGQKNIIQTKSSKIKETSRQSINTEQDEKDPIIQKLKLLMDTNKPYLEPELNIGNIANELHIHSHQLSKIINSKLGVNFFEFINEYRVNEFKSLAANPKNKHISILGLAMDAGFNSKATFNRIFKKTTGLTPSEFRENYKF